MDLKQLRALLAVADTGSTTRAGEVLNIVQPAVSRHIRLLETEMGTPLFTRGRHGMKLTEAGAVVAEHARRALRELDHARAEVQPAGAEVSGLVNLGLLPSTCDLIAGALAAAVAERHPQIRLRFTTGYAGHLQQWLEQGDLDVALLYDLRFTQGVEITPLLDEVMYVVGLPSSKLRVSRPKALAFLRDKPLILPSAPHGIRSLIDHACAVAGVELRIVAEANAMNLQRAFVLHGLGYTILPGAAILEDLRRGIVAAAPITGPPLRRTIAVALPSQRRISKATRFVADELRRQIERSVTGGNWPGANLVGSRRPNSGPSRERRA